jgi:hypothetical protein
VGAAASQIGSEVFGGDLCLAKEACDLAHFQLGMEWDDASLASTAHNDVTTTLPCLLETQTL